MKDIEKRKKGKYKKTFTIIIDGNIYKKNEEIVIGRDFEILNISNTYNPPINFEYLNDSSLKWIEE